MIAILSENCLQITLGSSFIISNYFSGDYNNDACDFILEVDHNCCGKKSYPLRVLHDFEVLISGCGEETIDGDDYGYFDFTITSTLAAGCVEKFTYSLFSDSSEESIIMYPTAFTFRHYFPIATTDTVTTVEFLTVNGLTYNLEIDIESINLLNPCNTAAVITETPTYPTTSTNTGLTFNAGSLTIDMNSMTFGQTVFPQGLPLQAGVYCFTIKGVKSDGVGLTNQGPTGQTLYQESATLFVDCEDTIKCQIASLAATCESVEGIWLYDALIFNNDCQNLTCNDVCNLYRKLKSFIDNSCEQPAKPCNCS
jgi:hypothetical protein